MLLSSQLLETAGDLWLCPETLWSRVGGRFQGGTPAQSSVHGRVGVAHASS